MGPFIGLATFGLLMSAVFGLAAFNCFQDREVPFSVPWVFPAVLASAAFAVAVVSIAVLAGVA